jgi:hypothetical protein
MSENQKDFLAKLRQIEELAGVVNGELPQNLLMLRTRVQHIIMLARALRGRIELGAVALVRVEPVAGAPLPGEPGKPTP